MESWRRVLEPGDDPERGKNQSAANRKKRLIQFYAKDGGLRTVAIDSIVQVK